MLSAHKPDCDMNLAAEAHVDRSIEGPAAFIQTNVVGTLHPYCRRRYTIGESLRRRRETGSVSSTSRPTRCSDHCGPTVLLRDHSLRAELALFGEQGRVGSSGPGLARDLRTADDHHQTSNNYGPYQFPEKLIPHIIIRGLGREEPAGLW